MNKAGKERHEGRVATSFLVSKENECFDDITTYVVELPVKEHKRIEVIEAKEKELENLKFYKTFEEVETQVRKKYQCVGL